MRKSLPLLALCLTVLLLLAGSPVFSQLINNGATITIQTNAKIICTGDVQNVTGTITNNGKLEVQGSFTNTGTYNTSTADDSLIMSGAGNVTINTGGASLNYLHINKDLSTNEVKLTGNSATVLTKFIFDQGSFTTDPINTSLVLSAPKLATFSFATGKEIIGRVKRTGWEVGPTVDIVFNQPNMKVTTAAGTAPFDFTVTMIPQSAGGNPTQTEREVTRKFQFAATGGTGYTSAITYPYLDGELNTNTEANLVPWQLVSSEWNSKTTSIARDGSANYVSISGISTTELTNEWKLADPKYTFNVSANLRGAWNGTSMNNSLNSVLPLGQPYNDLLFGSYNGGETVAPGFFTTHTNIVDWVLVDFRKPATGLPADANAASANAQKAAFLLTNGTIVDLDGVTPLPLTVTKQGQGFAVVRHRNHLAVMSPSTQLDATGNFTNDFRVLGNNYTNGSITSPPAQLLAGGSYGLWAGNANKDGTVNAGDVGLVKANANVTLTGYVFGDVNMDQTVNAGDVGIAKVSANSTAQAGSSRSINNGSKIIIEPKSHVPSN